MREFERHAWREQTWHAWRFTATDGELQSPLARGDGDLPLPKPFKTEILASKQVGIRPMSAYTTLTNVTPGEGIAGFEVSKVATACVS